MLVYRKNELLQAIRPISKNVARMSLIHAKTKTEIYIDFPVRSSLLEPLLKVSGSSPRGKKLNFTNVRAVSPYTITQEKDGVYELYEEVWDESKSLLDNFKDAIEVFEDSIFKALNERPPQAQPSTQEDEEPETFKKMPEIGNFVRVGKKFGKVLDVDQETREVDVQLMTEAAVMKELKAQYKINLERIQEDKDE